MLLLAIRNYSFGGAFPSILGGPHCRRFQFCCMGMSGQIFFQYENTNLKTSWCHSYTKYFSINPLANDINMYKCLKYFYRKSTWKCYQIETESSPFKKQDVDSSLLLWGIPNTSRNSQTKLMLVAIPGKPFHI